VILSPDVRVIVKSAGIGSVLNFVRSIVPEKVPLPMFDRVAGPVAVAPVAPRLPVAFVTVRVVLIVAACKVALSRTAKVKLARLRVM
jgi:hypothetical protein